MSCEGAQPGASRGNRGSMPEKGHPPPLNVRFENFEGDLRADGGVYGVVGYTTIRATTLSTRGS